MNYRVSEDLQLIQDILGESRRGLARSAHISAPTLDRWASGEVKPSRAQVEALYGYAFRRGLRLNLIKSQFYQEESTTRGRVVLFHGAKSALEGLPSCSRSRPNSDMGQGFYCGESFEQAAMFVHGFRDSSVYILSFDGAGLSSLRFEVGPEWMLTVALCRGRLEQYAGSPLLMRMGERLDSADYVVAPIADNRMYEIIDEYAWGEITDVQCEHALSAIDLGMQHVMRTSAATTRLDILERCYLSEPERAAYKARGEERSRHGRDKAAVARRQYRGQGHYIDEVLG